MLRAASGRGRLQRASSPHCVVSRPGCARGAVPARAAKRPRVRLAMLPAPSTCDPAGLRLEKRPYRTRASLSLAAPVRTPFYRAGGGRGAKPLGFGSPGS